MKEQTVFSLLVQLFGFFLLLLYCSWVVCTDQHHHSFAFSKAWTGLWNKEEQQWKIKGKKKQQKKSLTYRGEERDKIKNNSGKKNDLNIYGIETKEEKTKTPFNSFDTYSHRWSQLSFFFIIFCEVLPQCGAYRLVCLLVVLKAINWLFRANK